MTGDYGKPDRRSDANRAGQILRKLPNQSIPPLRIPANPQQPSGGSVEQPAPRLELAEVPPPQQTVQSPLDSPQQPEVLPSQAAKPDRNRGRKRLIKLPLLRLPIKSWQFWGVVLMLVFSGAGIFSAMLLLKLPALPNCPAIFWPTASASLRIYCAQLAANKRTVNDLLTAIDLVNELPDDHPLRAEVNRNIEEWSQEILELGEEAFQQGDLPKAIDTAQRIPVNTAAHRLVEKQIKTWNTTWDKAETIYQNAEDALRQQNLRQAFVLATRLLSVGNKYWETTKYRELNNLITETREDGSKLDKAKGLADQGGLKNLLAAIKLVDEVKPTSHLYQEAQRTIADFGRKMLDLAEDALKQRKYDEATSIAHQIPDKAGLQEEIKDFDTLAEAEAQAWGGTVADLEGAIVQAQKLKTDRPLYGKAQQLVSDWQLEIQDVKVLERARQLAEPGTSGDLRAAIAEVKQIPPGNPRGEEAQSVAARWTTQIETMEDQPYLDRAEQLAGSGDVSSLQAAINQASRIGVGRALYAKADQRIQTWTNRIQQIQDQPQLDRARQLASQGDLSGAIAVADQITPGRVLYNDAKSDIRNWTEQLQQTQDQPYLDRARQLASQGDLPSAIATAEQIGQGRALSDEAQAEIRTWRNQTQGSQMQQAYDAARIGTPTMLLSAIEIANQVPANSPTRPEADRMISQWSLQVLQLAETQAQYDPAGAIAIAERIPANTAAYTSAQQALRSWRQSLSPGRQR